MTAGVVILSKLPFPATCFILLMNNIAEAFKSHTFASFLKKVHFAFYRV